jgi:hypothetical protein
LFIIIDTFQSNQEANQSKYSNENRKIDYNEVVNYQSNLLLNRTSLTDHDEFTNSTLSDLSDTSIDHTETLESFNQDNDIIISQSTQLQTDPNVETQSEIMILNNNLPELHNRSSKIFLSIN